MKISQNKNILIQIITHRIMGLDSTSVKEGFSFPKNLSGFRFVNEIKIHKNKSYYSFGLYKNKKGHGAFAKIWSGDTYDLSYYWLKNEIQIYKNIKQVFDKNKTEVDQLFPTTGVPQLIFSKTKKDQLILLVEYIDGEKLNSLSPKFAKNYQNLLEFMNYIDKKFKQEKVNNVQKINPLVILAAYVLLVAKTIAKNPADTKTTIKALAYCVFNGRHLLDKNSLGFTHRDMAGNIIVSGKKAYATDFQISAETNKLMDFANLIQYYWERKSFLKEILKLPAVNTILQDPKSKRALKVSLLYTLMFDLNFNKNMRKKSIFECMNFVFGM